MKKKKLLVFATLLGLTLSSGAIIYATHASGNLVTNVADNEVGKVTFQNSGSNVSETFLVQEESINYYNDTTGETLYGGTPIFAKAEHCLTLGEASDRIANLFNSTVYFLDNNGDDFKFQSLTTIEIFGDEIERDIKIQTSYDGEHYTDQWLVTNNSGHSTFSILNSHYVRFYTGGSMEFTLYKVILNYSCSYDYVEPEVKTVTIYASNDFHGKIEQSGDEVGLEKYATYFKDKSDDENTLLIDSGDSWQGSAYSNLNYGNLINDVMVEAGWDVRTIGNHDFDWGVDRLKANTARVYKGKTLTTLAANVYDYDFDLKTFGEVHQDDIGDRTATFTLENGLKVGVVGVIGYSQITSINSQYTHDIGFKNHVDTIKSEANKLRSSGCDIVIASCHTGEEEVRGYGLSDYVDLVLCAHTHRFEVSSEGNLYFAQFGSNGRGAGKITLSYDTELNDVVSTTVETIYSSTINSEVISVDPTIHELVSTSNASCDTIASEVVANNVTGTFYKGNTLEDLMAKAVYDAAIDEGYTNLVCSFINDARVNELVPTDGKITYSDIYSAFPFDNRVYIIEATAREMMNEINKYNYVYFSEDFVNGGKTVHDGTKYQIAVLDYLLFHTNDSRYYNYFDDNNGNYVGILSDNYRMILKNWLSDNGYNSGTELNPDDFNKGDTRFNNKYQLTLIGEYDLTFMMNDGTDNVYETINDVSLNELITDHVPAVNPERTNYTFGGWYLNQACTQSINGLTVTSNLTIYAKWTSDVEPPAKGTEGNPFTVSEAITHIDTYGNDGNTYYVKGTITGEVLKSTYSEAYRFVITDGVNQFTAYYANWAGDAPVEGDFAVLSGEIMYYTNGGIYETKSGTGTVVSITKTGERADNPFTILQAINHINTYGNNGNTYYVTGIVVDGSIVQSTYVDQGYKYKFIITDGANEFTAYYADCSITGAPNGGDTVVISGQLMLYNESVYETVANTGTLVSIL